ncbi:choice-of-anchor U domain-containing protein [Chloroflexota bacterium]
MATFFMMVSPALAYIPPPIITGVNPNAGNQGQIHSIITITGSNFNGATAVNFGAGITVNASIVDSDIQIRADITIDGGAAVGPRDVSVTTPGGTGTLNNGFTVNQPTQQVNTATGTGIAVFTTNNGSMTTLTAPATTPCGSHSRTFPHGFFSFNVTNIVPAGSAITITITLPSAMPVGTEYWKCQNGIWINVTSLLGDDDGDNVLTLTITDGGLGDADGIANGTIVDPGGPTVAITTAEAPSSAPTMHIPNPSRIIVPRITVEPQQAEANQPVTIYANVVNRGDIPGTYTADLKINGEVMQTRSGDIGANMGIPLKFTVYQDQPGTYTVDINGQKSFFTIVGQANSRGDSVTNPNIFVYLFVITLIFVILISAILATRRFNQSNY